MGFGSRNVIDSGGFIKGSMHPEGHLADEETLQRYEFAARGILKTRDGLIAGMWIKGKRGKRYVYLLDTPLPPAAEQYVTERRDVEINGEMHRDVEVRVYKPITPFIAWLPVPEAHSDAE